MCGLRLPEFSNGRDDSPRICANRSRLEQQLEQDLVLYVARLRVSAVCDLEPGRLPGTERDDLRRRPGPSPGQG